MLQSVSGIGIDAARVARDTPVHQLSLCFERERFRVKRQDPPWKVVRAFALPDPAGWCICTMSREACWREIAWRWMSKSKAGAAAQITTTGATRLYRHRAGAADSEQHATILGRRRGAAGISSGCRDPICGIPPRTAHGDPAGARGDSVLVGSAGARAGWLPASVSLSSGCACKPRSMPVRGRSCGKIFCWSLEETTWPRWRGCSSTRTLPACARFRRGGRRVLASAGRPIERDRSGANAARASGLGREHAGVGRSDRAGLEHERMLHSRDAGRILENRAAGRDGRGCGRRRERYTELF